MRIDCKECGKALQVPDEKVPDRAFSITCPGCQNKITVDPTQKAAPAEQPAPADETAPSPAAAAPPAESQAAPTQPAAEPTSAPTADSAPAPPAKSAHDVAHDGELRSLRSHEVELFENLSPVAFVVHLDESGGEDPSALNAQLQSVGMKEIRHFEDLAVACEQAEEAAAGLLLVRMAKAPAPPCEPLEPIYRMPPKLRRRTFVALAADNVRTLDGQVAFYLQVNCLIHSSDLPHLAVPLRRALLHQLRLYRHWWDTVEES